MNDLRKITTQCCLLTAFVAALHLQALCTRCAAIESAEVTRFWYNQDWISSEANPNHILAQSALQATVHIKNNTQVLETYTVALVAPDNSILSSGVTSVPAGGDEDVYIDVGNFNPQIPAMNIPLLLRNM